MNKQEYLSQSEKLPLFQKLLMWLMLFFILVFGIFIGFVGAGGLL